MSGKRFGFTIVELTIVVVVIGILASISLVAYSGVQRKAQNTRTIAAAKSYIDVFSAYAINNKAYPSTATYPCLGAYTGNACARVSGSTTCFSNGGAVVDGTFDSQLQSYFNNKPSPSQVPINCSGNKYLGMYMDPNSANTTQLRFAYFLVGDVACPTLEGSTNGGKVQQDDLTRCYVAMPNL